MRSKHVTKKVDTALLNRIYDTVDKELEVPKSRYRTLLWTKFVVYFASAMASYVLLFQGLHWIVFIGMYVLFGFLSLLFAFNFSHDFSHDTVFENKRWNYLCFVAIYTLVGAHAEAWKDRHISSHHHAPNVDGHDSDLKISKLIRVIPGSRYFWFHRFQHWYAPFAYMTYSLFWIFVKDFTILFSEERTAKTTRGWYHLSFWAQKLVYALLLLGLPILFSGQHWYVVVLSFLLMHMLQSVFLLFTFFMTHHVENTHYPKVNEEGKIGTSWVMNQILSSNDMHPFSETVNFIMGGFNCHVAHHLFPHVHHIYYPALNRILYRVLKEHGIIPNQTTYVGGIVSHLRLLKRMSVR